jgi:ubiquinone/menaquinone biosynthesis C-methylase UbiE
MTQAKGYVNTEYLQVVAEFVKQLKQRSYALMQIQSGQRILDVGCGPATDTIQLAPLVGQTGQVFGVDNDQAMIDEADLRADKAGVTAWVKHKRGDATSLCFDANYFDACRSERLFQHLSDPERALSEMTRVTRTGGWIVVLDTDWGSLSIDTTEVDIERRLARVHAERGLHNGYAGRQLYRLFKQEKLMDIAVELHPLFATDYAFTRHGVLLNETEHIALTAGIVTEEELQRWRASLEQADSDGAFFVSVNQIMAVGRKPG